MNLLRAWRRNRRRGYQETSVHQRLHDQREDHVLRAVGAGGYGYVYLCSGGGISRIWTGEHQYASDVDAVVAASAHIRDALQGLLENTPERVLTFTPDPTDD